MRGTCGVGLRLTRDRGAKELRLTEGARQFMSLQSREALILEAIKIRRRLLHCHDLL